MTLDDFKILVREAGSSGYWGWGDTIPEARKAARNPRYYEVYIATRDTSIDELGDLCYPAGCRPRLIQAVLPAVRRRRKT